jgi:CheY-like chemotaxis protein
MNLVQSEAELPLSPQHGRQTNAAGYCILVVEDDDADAYLIERALLANPDVGGIIRATDGEEALHLVEIGAVAPDIALIDLHMPRKNGFHLLVDFAVSRQPRFPMVVLTSSTAPTDAMRSRLRGATRVLTKPDSVDALEELLTMAITSACTGITLPDGPRPDRLKRRMFDNSPPKRRGEKIRPIERQSAQTPSDTIDGRGRWPDA